MAFKPVGDVLRGRRDEMISARLARLLNGHSGPQAGGHRSGSVPAAGRTGACGSLMEKTARVPAYQADSRDAGE